MMDFRAGRDWDLDFSGMEGGGGEEGKSKDMVFVTPILLFAGGDFTNYGDVG